ncbi:MAG: hypothetical protein KGI27_15750, partial [Thaumarchaeota archaeon]|nr:hypothetical protein [Nitrososphaerota archaeon]
KTWGTLPRNYTKFYSVVDGNGTDILDYSRMPYPFMVTAELRTYPAICGSEKVTGEGGHPPVMPIKKGHSIVYAENAEMGLLPDSNGAYSFKFLSLFDTKVEFPRDSHVITNQTETCFLENKIDNYTEAFYTNVSFKTD